MSNEWLQNLKEGDPVIVDDGNRRHLAKVLRITKTQIVTNYDRYRRTDGEEVGGSTWHTRSLLEATDECVRQITESQYRIKMIAKLRDARWHNCKTETLEKVVSLFDEDPEAI